MISGNKTQHNNVCENECRGCSPLQLRPSRTVSGRSGLLECRDCGQSSVIARPAGCLGKAVSRFVDVCFVRLCPSPINTNHKGTLVCVLIEQVCVCTSTSLLFLSSNCVEEPCRALGQGCRGTGWVWPREGGERLSAASRPGVGKRRTERGAPFDKAIDSSVLREAERKKGGGETREKKGEKGGEVRFEKDDDGVLHLVQWTSATPFLSCDVEEKRQKDKKREGQQTATSVEQALAGSGSVHDSQMGGQLACRGAEENGGLIFFLFSSFLVFG